MHFNTSFNQFGSVSPAQSFKSSLKENHNESINSNVDSRLKASVSTQQYTQKPGNDPMHTVRLESKILQMQKKIDQQKYQIDTLTSQTESFMNLCEEQKKVLSSYNIDMLKQQYEEQITELIAQKEKLTQLIETLAQEYRLTELQQQDEVRMMKAKNQQLANRIESAMNKKQSLLKEISIADKIHQENEEIIIQQEERLDSLRNIERKLFIALRQMESLEKNK